MSQLTRRQRELKAKYIYVRKVLGGYQAELSIGCQAFGIGYISAGKRSAGWTRNMLAIALDTFFDEECKMVK